MGNGRNKELVLMEPKWNVKPELLSIHRHQFRINGTKVECKAISKIRKQGSYKVLMEPKWNVKGQRYNCNLNHRSQY